MSIKISTCSCASPWVLSLGVKLPVCPSELSYRTDKAALTSNSKVWVSVVQRDWTEGSGGKTGFFIFYRGENNKNIAESHRICMSTCLLTGKDLSLEGRCCLQTILFSVLPAPRGPVPQNLGNRDGSRNPCSTVTMQAERDRTHGKDGLK